MTTYTNLHALLSARPVTLWVEDMLTKEYLQRIWQPDDIFFQILIKLKQLEVLKELAKEGRGKFIIGLKSDEIASLID
ncbi:MAG: hypothetical protein GY795_49335 [Desulfobacterales bacterium]|nr:hypothetical protein [Desulfobacterales bacterium]